MTPTPTVSFQILSPSPYWDGINESIVELHFYHALLISRIKLSLINNLKFELHFYHAVLISGIKFCLINNLKFE